jgi:hypothetical protein
VDINELEFSGQIVARDPRGHDDEQAQKGTCDARRPSRTNIAGDQPRVWNGPQQVLDVPLPFQGVKDGERDGLNSSGRVGLQSHESVVERSSVVSGTSIRNRSIRGLSMASSPLAE